MNWIKKIYQDWRHSRAMRIRNDLKRCILIDDMHDFFAGKKTEEQSRKWRDHCYYIIDSMTDDEILRRRWSEAAHRILNPSA